MAIIKISELPAATSPVSPADVLPVVQNGVTKKAAINEFGYLPNGSNAITTTIQTKLRETVSAKDFGAVGDGVSDDTSALKAAFDYAIPLGIPVELEGTYLVSGPIQPYASRASGSAHIVCKGHVTINVSGSASGFRDLFYHETVAANSCSITGGSLSIDCNNKAASGISFRSGASSPSGTVNISCPVEILNCFNTDASATYENQALFVFGDYESITIERARVVGVDRAGVGVPGSAGCKGISIAGFTQTVTINQPYVANVLTGTGSADADGIGTFGKLIGTVNNARPGRVNINEPIFVDCKGRSYKSQCSDSTVFRPRVYRKNVVSIANSSEFEFQFGGQSLVIEPYFDYQLNGGVSPLGGSHSCIVFQQNADNVQNVGKSIGGVIRTEVLIPRYVAYINLSTSLASVTEVDGLVIQPIGSLTTTAISRAIIEFQADQVGAKSAKTFLAVRNCRGPIGANPIGYVTYDGSVLTSKLSIEITNNTNTLASPQRNVFIELSGSRIPAIESFVFRYNSGFSSVSTLSSFNFNNLLPGNIFTVDLSTTAATNAPPWGAIGYGYVEVIDQWFGSTDKNIRVTVNTAEKGSERFYSRDGGVTWTSEVAPSVSAANIAAAAATVNTRNKLAGLLIYDTTNNRIMVSSGTSATSPWYVADGSASVTPS